MVCENRVVLRIFVDALEHFFELIFRRIVVAKIRAVAVRRRPLDHRKLVHVRQHVHDLLPRGLHSEKPGIVDGRHLHQLDVPRNALRKQSSRVALFDLHFREEVTHKDDAAGRRGEHLDVTPDVTDARNVRCIRHAVDNLIVHLLRGFVRRHNWLKM